VLVGPQGGVTRLSREDVMLDVRERWTSESGATYPAKWRLRVPSANLDLTVTPYFEDQVMNTSVRYWEGAVRVESPAGSAAGSGYVELTGYGNEESGEGESGILP
jgi:predicted secreted hydrolase